MNLFLSVSISYSYPYILIIFILIISNTMLIGSLGQKILGHWVQYQWMLKD